MEFKRKGVWRIFKRAGLWGWSNVRRGEEVKSSNCQFKKLEHCIRSAISSGCPDYAHIEWSLVREIDP